MGNIKQTCSLLSLPSSNSPTVSIPSSVNCSRQGLVATLSVPVPSTARLHFWGTRLSGQNTKWKRGIWPPSTLIWIANQLWLPSDFGISLWEYQRHHTVSPYPGAGGVTSSLQELPWRASTSKYQQDLFLLTLPAHLYQTTRKYQNVQC